MCLVFTQLPTLLLVVGFENFEAVQVFDFFWHRPDVHEICYHEF